MFAALESHLWAYPALEMVHLSGIALLLCDLAPLTRLQAWKVDEIKPGTQVSVLGFTFAGEKGAAVLRAEYLFVDGKAYGLRSSPA